MPRLCHYCACLWLAGCGVAGRIDVAGPGPAAAVAVTDTRPAVDRAGGIHAAPGGREHHFGDDALAPAPPVLLARALTARDPAGFGGRLIELREFTVAVFEPSARLPDSAGMATGAVYAGPVAAILGYGVIAGIEHARSRKILTVRISGSVDGRPFVADRTADTRGRVTGRQLARLVDEALAEAAERAAAAATGS
jgi:hypothetical protein